MTEKEWSILDNHTDQLSIFLIDLFVGTYRLSSHARLETLVIQTKLKLNYTDQLSK